MRRGSGTGHFGYTRYQRTIRESLLYRRADNSCEKFAVAAAPRRAAPPMVKVPNAAAEAYRVGEDV